jgi:hypothetical protein
MGPCRASDEALIELPFHGEPDQERPVARVEPLAQDELAEGTPTEIAVSHRLVATQASWELQRYGQPARGPGASSRTPTWERLR